MFFLGENLILTEDVVEDIDCWSGHSGCLLPQTWFVFFFVALDLGVRDAYREVLFSYCNFFVGLEKI